MINNVLKCQAPKSGSWSRIKIPYITEAISSACDNEILMQPINILKLLMNWIKHTLRMHVLWIHSIKLTNFDWRQRYKKSSLEKFMAKKIRDVRKKNCSGELSPSNWSIKFFSCIFLKNRPRLLLLLNQKRSNLLKVTVVLTPSLKTYRHIDKSWNMLSRTYWQ